jgi:hypothetical protein
MTVWQVRLKDTNEGAYIVAPTCAAAKEVFHALYGDGFLIRARHIKNVEKTDFPSAAVLLPGDPRLAALRLRYKGQDE